LQYIIYFVVSLFLIFAIVSFLVFKKMLKSNRNRMVRYLGREVERARRAGRSLGFLLIEIDNSVPRGTSELLPGRTLMVTLFEDAIRNTDVLERTAFRIYTIILTETNHMEGSQIVKERIRRVATEKGWGKIKIGMASYPENGDTAEDLINFATKDGGITQKD
jgi:GGDEF domain-containing protein